MSRNGRLTRTLWVVLLGAGPFAPAAGAQTYDVLAFFNSVASPFAGLIQGTDGNLYGTTTRGASGYGTIFKIDTTGSTFTTLHSFANSDGANPYAGPIQATDGSLYGTTYSGGAGGYGTIFKISTDGSTFTTLHSFTGGSDGANPYGGLVQGTDGNLYGTTYFAGASNYGTIFKIDTTGSTFTTLHSFAGSDGSNPYAGLIQGTDGNLYGTTYSRGAGGQGTIFKIDTNGTTFKTLHSFPDSDGDGSNPYAGLIQGTDGYLYGTTTGGYGMVFKVDTNGTTLTRLHYFTGSDGATPFAGLVQASDGNLYGTTYQGGANNLGTIFKMSTNGSTFTTLHSFAGSDGANPYAGLIQGTDGNLYGTTYQGSASRSGTIFKTDTNGSTFTTLHSFSGSNGADPYAGLIQGSDGNLYGTTAGGGGGSCTPYGGCGTIFKIDISGAISTLHNFVNSDGANPQADLIQGTDGNLYGTTFLGGANGLGTIFKIDTNGATFTTLHNFAGSDGANSYAGLVQGNDGSLYGTTTYGGASNQGTIFKIDTNGTTLTTLHSFAGTDGWYPVGSLIQAMDGNLYGTTNLGGYPGNGTIFKIDTSGSAFTTLHSFAGYPSEGAYPYAGLIQGTDGSLYGTTTYGGTANNYGTIFKIDTSGSTFTTLHYFAGSDGANSYAGLVQGNDGSLYGTTYQGGASANGTIFKIDTKGSTLTTLHSFTGSDGASPFAGLIQGTDGNLYGTTKYGGANSGGVVFKMVLCSLSPPLVVTASGSTTFCPGGSVTLDAGAGYSSYLWSPGGETTQSIVVTTPGRYTVAVTDASGCHGGSSAPIIVQVGFDDVPPTDPFYTFICTIAGDGITAGCGGGNYCSNHPVTRAQMAVFLLRAEHGSSYTPPVCTPGIFGDVPCPGGFAVDWIEQLSIEGITTGCGGGNYCPDQPVTRAQMAVFLLRAEHGPGYAPPMCSGLFSDVPCPGGFAVDWIEQLSIEGITGGCGGGSYCPDTPNTRGQMAVFLVTTFGL